MRFLRQSVFCCFTLAFPVLIAQSDSASDARPGAPQATPIQVEQLFALGNQARASYGLAPLKWDQALAAGAVRHCLRMAQGGPIAHQYRDEPDVTERAAQAGAHFSLIEENIAVGPYSSGIHQGWMTSPEHRANLLNTGIDRVGIAVVAHGGVLYAVADYAHIVSLLTQAQVESGIAALLRVRGLAILNNAVEARSYCASTGRLSGADAPNFLIRWQGSDVSELTPELARRVASGAYRQAAVGSCAAQNVNGPFTVYRVAVLLYETDAAAFADR